jgi:hypothetical protein
MKNLRKQLITGLVVAFAGMTAACADMPAGPSAARGPHDAVAALGKSSNGGKKGNGKQDAETIDLSQFVDTLSRAQGTLLSERWVTALGGSVTSSATIGSEGGWVELAATGSYLYVPKGTVSAPTTFSIKAMAGKLVAFDFQPAGSVFKTPVFLVQDKTFLSNNPLTSVLSLVGATQQLGYVPDEATLDQLGMTAKGQELRPNLLDNTQQYLAYPIYHFSGYIVSWGFRDMD